MVFHKGRCKSIQWRKYGFMLKPLDSMDTIQEFKSHLHTDPDRLVHPQGSDCHIKAVYNPLIISWQCWHPREVRLVHTKRKSLRIKSLWSRWIFILPLCKIWRRNVDVPMRTPKITSLITKSAYWPHCNYNKTCFPKSSKTTHSRGRN